MGSAREKPNYPECLEDSHGNATLTDDAQPFSNNSATLCASHCKKLRNIFSATQGNICTCGDTITKGIRISNKCNTKCPGDEKETCGGEESVSLRRTGSAREKPNYPECFEDTHGNATLTDNAQLFRNNSATQCASHCKTFQYIFSGTQGNICTCGENISIGIRTSTSKECNTKCPGDEKETCGGKGRVSLRRTGYVKGTTEMPGTTKQKTSSEIPVTPGTTKQKTSSEIPVTPGSTKQKTSSEIPVTPGTTKQKTSSEISVTPGTTKQKTSSMIPVTFSPATESTRNTATVFPSTKARTIDSTEGSQMTALYITLPVVVIVAGAVTLIVCLMLRYRRQTGKARLKRLTVSACSSKNVQDSKRKQQLENYNRRTQEVEVARQKNNADDMCDADYSTVSDSNDTVENNQDYDKINAIQTTGTKTHAIYSHLKLTTGIPNSNTTDNTYSHIGSASEVCINTTDNTYNTVQFSQRAKETGAPSLVQDDQNSVYDSANGRDKSRVNDMNEYDHINTHIASK